MESDKNYLIDEATQFPNSICVKITSPVGILKAQLLIPIAKLSESDNTTVESPMTQISINLNDSTLNDTPKRTTRADDTNKTTDGKYLTV